MSNDRDIAGTSRRDLFKIASVSAGAAAGLFGGLGFNPLMMAAMAKEAGRSTKPLKAAFSNAGLQATWCAQGKRAAEYWGKLFNVEVTWFDGELGAAKQRAAIDNMASQKWDFVAIQAFGIGTLTAARQQDDRRRHPRDRHGHADRAARQHQRPHLPRARQRVHGRIGDPGPRRQAWAAKGKIVMTQGALGHTGAQGRAKGFEVRRQEVPEDRGARHPARGLGRHQGRPHLGDPADEISRRSTPPSSTMTTWRSPPTTS